MKKAKKQSVLKKVDIGCALILPLLIRSCLFVMVQQKNLPLNTTYLSKIKVVGGGSFFVSNSSNSVPPPKDGTFSALYHFKELNHPNSTNPNSSVRK